MAWENSENLDFPWKYPKYPHIFCPASLVKFGEKWDTLLYILYAGLYTCTVYCTVATVQSVQCVQKFTSQQED